MAAKFRENIRTYLGAACAIFLGSSFTLSFASPLGDQGASSGHLALPLSVVSLPPVGERESEHVERASEVAVTISSREDEAAEPASREEPAGPAEGPPNANAGEIAENESGDEVSRYLWHVYQRSTVKFDSSGDFSWKDSDAAAHLGMSMSDYVIGGMDADFREQLFAMGHAMDAAGIDWTIRSAFRDDYRQGLASGYKAHAGNSFHGGGAATGGYGHGCAVDLASPDGLSNQTVWNWIDQHAETFGLHRPLREIDAPHVQPHGAWHAIGAALRHERLARRPGGSVEEALAISADQVSRARVTEEQYMCLRAPRPAVPPMISTVHTKSLPKVAINLMIAGAEAHHVKEDGKEKTRDRAATHEKEKAVAKAREKDGNHHSKAKPKLNVAARGSTPRTSA